MSSTFQKVWNFVLGEYKVRATIDASNQVVQHVRLADSNGDGLSTLDMRISDGTDTATVASAFDSRNGLDIQHSSVALKNLVNYSSTPTPLLASASKILSPDGTRTGLDLGNTSGYPLLLISAADNTSGAGGFSVYAIWSNDNTNTIWGDPLAGGGNLHIIHSGLITAGSIIPRLGRYVYFVMTNGTVDQGSSYPQCAELRIDALPAGFTSTVTVANNALTVIGYTANTDDAAGQPVIMGGTDYSPSPTALYSIKVDSSGTQSFTGVATTYTGTALVTSEKLQTSVSTQGTAAIAAISTQFLASNTDRMSFSVENRSANTMYIKCGTACSASSYDWRIEPFDRLYVDAPRYSGVLHYFTGVASGNIFYSDR